MSTAAKLPASLLLIEENRFARAALGDVLLTEEQGGPRLVFLFGPSGTGKSLLVSEFLAYADRELDAVRASVNSVQFALEFSKAAREGTIPDFQERYRSVDLLVCEDVHSIEGRGETLMNLFAAIDDVLHSSAGRVVVTSRKPPGDLRGFPSKLIDRFRAGVTAAVAMPKVESRRDLLLHFAEELDVNLTRAAAELIAAELELSPRELRAVVIHLQAASADHGKRELDADAARTYLGGEVTSPSVPVSEIAHAVARHFEVSVTGMRAKGRTQAVVRARQCAMYLARSATSASHASIGTYFGDRHHSTVLRACRSFEADLQNSPGLRRDISQIRQSLGLE